MTQEDKQLLIKDLCARLPYRVRIAYKENEFDSHHWTLSNLHAPHFSKDDSIIDIGSDGWIEFVEYPGAGMETASRPLHLEKMLPYLRPMSSMTKKENEELKYVIELGLQALDGEEGHNTVSAAPAAFEIDFYNKHHFDYRGLIEKGLALEAPANMYKTE